MENSIDELMNLAEHALRDDPSKLELARIEYKACLLHLEELLASQYQDKSMTRKDTVFMLKSWLRNGLLI